MPTRAYVLHERESELAAISEYSSIVERGGDKKGYSDIDMEAWRLALVGRMGFKHNFEGFFEMPFYHMSGGFLDGFVQDFHRAFGFPNAGRERLPNGRFKYMLIKDGRIVYDYPPVTFLWGDLKLGIRHQVLGESRFRPALSLSFSTRLPTGKQSRGVGSRGMDFLLGVDLEKGGKRWGIYFNTAYAVMSNMGTDEDLVKNVAWQSSLAGEIIISRWVSFVAQLVGGTPELQGVDDDEWNGWPLDFMAGFQGKVDSAAGRWGWRVGFAEDITSQGPSVDFTVLMSVSWRPFKKLSNHN